MCGWLVSVDDVLQRHGTPSQTGPSSTPEAIQDQQSSGGSFREVSMFGDSPSLGVQEIRRYVVEASEKADLGRDLVVLDHRRIVVVPRRSGKVGLAASPDDELNKG